MIGALGTASLAKSQQKKYRQTWTLLFMLPLLRPMIWLWQSLALLYSKGGVATAEPSQKACLRYRTGDIGMTARVVLLFT
jgi:hypothetical protein